MVRTSIFGAMLVVRLYREIATAATGRLAMTVVVVTWLRRFKQLAKLKFEVL